MNAASDLGSWIRSAKIWVVDDQEPWVKMVSAVLSAWGARPIGAESVARAEGLLTQYSIDMVISDLVMPIEDGFHLIRWIRHHPDKTLQRTPVALMTSETSLLNIKRAQCCGADLVIEKPLKPDVLWQRMGAVVAKGATGPRPLPPCGKTLEAPCPMIPPPRGETDAPAKAAATAASVVVT